MLCFRSKWVRFSFKGEVRCHAALAARWSSPLLVVTTAKSPAVVPALEAEICAQMFNASEWMAVDARRANTVPDDWPDSAIDRCGAPQAAIAAVARDAAAPVAPLIKLLRKPA